MSDKIHNYFFNFPKEMPWKENKMNTKEKKLELVKELRETLYELEVYQDQPWTFVKFLVLVEGTKEHTKVIKLFGFSKVCHPDEWDADYGVELAITKALYKLAKEILSK